MTNKALYQTVTTTLHAGTVVGNAIHRQRNASPVLISGSPRGGTTWIAESVVYALGTRRLLWEPLQEGNLPKHGRGFSRRPFITPEGGAQNTQEDFFAALLQGRYANPHLLRLRSQPRDIWRHLFSGDRLVIKFVRGNGVMGYLAERFELPKPLVVVRHPCAVVASQMKMGSWQDHPNIDPKLVAYYPHIADVIDENTSLPERLAMTWAGDVLAARAYEHSLNIVHYEDVVRHGAQALASTFVSWGWRQPPAGLEEVLGKPSSTTHKWSRLDDVESKLNRWREQLDADTVHRIFAVCNAMGVDDYQ